MKLRFNSAMAAALMLPSALAATVGTIQSTTSGKCWQISSDKTTIEGATCDETNANQIFHFDPATTFLKHEQSGLCVDGNPAFAHTFGYACSSASANHKWKTNANGLLETFQAGNCVHTGADGKLVHIACAGLTEKFKSVKARPSPFKIQDHGSGKCWEFNAGTAGNTNYVMTSTCDDSSPNQLFETNSWNQLKLHQTNVCVDGNKEGYDHPFPWGCGGDASGGGHNWMLTVTGDLRTEADASHCFYEGSGNRISGGPCSANTGVSVDFVGIAPSAAPSAPPSGTPSAPPSGTPSATPSVGPSAGPSASPSSSSSAVPSGNPSAGPSPSLSAAPADFLSSLGTKSGSSSGDPHFKTWSGDKFDFHGGCDLILLKAVGFANGLGLNIHIRTKINTWWSYIQSAVVQIGSDTLEVSGGDDGGSHWINGKAVEKLKDGEHISLSGFKAVFHRVSSKQQRFRIELGNQGENIMSIETYKEFVRVNVRVKNTNNFMGTVGLMGSYPSGAMNARDGTTLLNDAEAFGTEWQVLASEPMLFHDLGDGVHHPQVCAMPDKTTKRRRRLGESMLTEEDAALACARVDEDERDACIFDVLATNDKDMAGSY